MAKKQLAYMPPGHYSGEITGVRKTRNKDAITIKMNIDGIGETKMQLNYSERDAELAKKLYDGE